MTDLLQNIESFLQTFLQKKQSTRFKRIILGNFIIFIPPLIPHLFQDQQKKHPHTIHVWYIYLHLPEEINHSCR